ncbi:pre-rRNA-processing protein pno1 [Tulasnella sp. 330]|nr:pre-rRNA-processing protein pno1 [Tulasnella sp. 330]KAG8889913.1 pre-rRNA-processing protein pno1 [Tulasnella sp. 332]
MAPLPSASDIQMANMEATKRKVRRGRRSAASEAKRQARHKNAGAGPSRDVLMANRDAEVEEDAEDAVVIDPRPTTLPSAIILDDETTPESTEPFKGIDTMDEATAFFAPLDQEAASGKLEGEMRRIPIPPHRMAPLKKEWVNIFTPLTEMLGLQVRMNLLKKAVEMRTSKHTKEVGAIQKGADFVRAFTYGFLIAASTLFGDAIALLRLDDLYLDSFEIKDVKSLSGDHLSRAIGRIAGQDGKTRFTIENATRTRVILADTKVHILGSFQNIKLAKDAIVALILGSPPGKVYASLRTIGARLKQRAF